MLATEITAWMQMLARAGTSARVWEPERLRLRLFQIAGRIAHRTHPPRPTFLVGQCATATTSNWPTSRFAGPG